MFVSRLHVAPYSSCRPSALAIAVVLALGCVAGAGDDPLRPVDFASQVRPIFARSCLKCHGPEKQRGGFRLDARASALAGGESGEPALVPGDASASFLLERVASADEDLRMPPRGERLSAAEIGLLTRWVAEGARWAEAAPGSAAKAGPAQMAVTEGDREHWAFLPLREVEPPALEKGENATSAIDRFLGAGRRAKGLAPVAEADRRTLIRRAAFDLTGLPPSPEEVASFVADPAPLAYERLVDRLLASPRHGERWGRHWLDLARYADSDGYENDLDRKTAYLYRDFVIRALNDDMPFDRFVRLQIAGDELDPDDSSAVVATGFCTAAPSQETTPADTDENKQKIRFDELDNILATAGSGLLGLTVGCARCHDHKFDPIPTRDYYRMLAAFTSAERREAPLSRPHRELERWKQEQRRLYREDRMTALGLNDEQKFWLRQPEHFFVPIQIGLYKAYGKQLNPSDEALRSWLTGPKRATLAALEAEAAKAKDAGADPRARALVLLDRGSRPEPSFVLGRGSVSDKKEVVTVGFLQVVTRGASTENYLARVKSRVRPVSADDPTLGTTYGRAALAEWLTDRDCGAGALLARVIVNRLWQHHLGEGLVRTPDDFGTTGDRPAHPELLDWLACELIRGGWRLKPIHRIIMSSDTYRLGVAFDPARAAIDSENRMIWRRRPSRLEAEALRDAMLAVAGLLNPAMHGPPFRPRIPAEAIATRSKDAYPTNFADGRHIRRRSIYGFIKRSVPDPAAEVFDAPDPTSTCGRRNITAVPTQNLALLNDPFVRDCARALARRSAGEAATGPTERVRHAYELALGRLPSAGELRQALKFLSESDNAEAWTDLCHVLFTLNEFLYVD
jgi:mono/diheme cytochrome c family protein